MAMQKTYADLDLGEQGEHTVRVLLADKRLALQTAKRNKWDEESIDSMQCLAYFAAKRVGLTESSYSDFIDSELIDLAVHNNAPEADDDAEAPTSASSTA